MHSRPPKFCFSPVSRPLYRVNLRKMRYPTPSYFNLPSPPFRAFHTVAITVFSPVSFLVLEGLHVGDPPSAEKGYPGAPQISFFGPYPYLPPGVFYYTRLLFFERCTCPVPFALDAAVTPGLPPVQRWANVSRYARVLSMTLWLLVCIHSQSLGRSLPFPWLPSSLLFPSLFPPGHAVLVLSRS